MPTPDPLAQARRDVLTPELAAIVPSVTESAWSQLKAARGQPISLCRAQRLADRHHLIAQAPAPAAPICTTLDLDAAVARATPAIHRALVRRGYPVGRASAWLRGQAITPETGGAA